MRGVRRVAGGRVWRLVVALGFGMALGACSKCDIPTYQPNRAPLSCHGDTPVQ